MADELTLDESYFAWLLSFLWNSDIPKKNYSVLYQLYKTEFIYSNIMDGNRAADGVDLRYRFADETRRSQVVIACELDIRPCSVLEMMLALAIRCETHIMSDDTYGDRTGVWFGIMLDSLGLSYITNDQYSKNRVTDIIFRFMNRQYEADGKGGLFWIPGTEHDMRQAEIWYQLNWYLDYYISKEK